MGVRGEPEEEDEERHKVTSARVGVERSWSGMESVS